MSLIEITVMSNKSKLLQWQVDLRKYWSTLVNGVRLQDISSHLIEYNVLKPELWEYLKKRRITEKDRMEDFLLIPLYMYFRGMHACMIMYVIVCLFVHVLVCVDMCLRLWVRILLVILILYSVYGHVLRPVQLLVFMADLDR